MVRIRVSFVLLLGFLLASIFLVSIPVRGREYSNKQHKNPLLMKQGTKGDERTIANSFHSIKLDVPDTRRVVISSAAQSISDEVLSGEFIPNPLQKRSGRKTLSEATLVESPSQSPTESLTESPSESITHGITSVMTVAFEGEYCSSDDLVVCAIGLLCNSLNVCVGPAKTGKNCSLDSSQLMCDNGNWCDCSVDGESSGGDYSNNACVCVAEKGKNAVCTYDYQCIGGLACNFGKCTRLYSLGINKRAKSIDFCEPGLGLNKTNIDGSGTCQRISDVSCNAVTDCTPGGRGVFDEIFYTCTNNKCAYTGPYCWYYLPMIAQRGKHNNYYDGSEPRVTLETYENYGYCVYSEFVAAGSHFSKGDMLIQLSYYFEPSQRTWVEKGFPCAFSGARCMMGSYCTVHNICELYPHEGQPCGPAYGPGSVGDPYTVCDIYGYLTCDVAASATHVEDYGPLGKCVRGAKKNGTACSYHMQADSQYPSVDVWVTTACDMSDSYYCNFIESGVDAASGYCARFGSVGPGQKAYWGAFCEPDLYFNYRTDYTCKTFEEADVRCNAWNDCIDYVRGYFGTYYYDEHQVYEPHAYGWNYDNWLQTQVGCVNNKCAYFGPTDCDSRYRKATEYTTRDLDFPKECPYVKCQLDPVTAPDYVLCAGSSGAFSISPFFSSNILIMLLSVLAMALF